MTDTETVNETGARDEGESLPFPKAPCFPGFISRAEAACRSWSIGFEAAGIRPPM